MTVTGTTRLSSSKIWVMPSLVPRMPLEAMRVPSWSTRRAAGGSGRVLRERVLGAVGSELDLDVDTRGEREAHQLVDGLLRRLVDVDEALVGAHLEVLAGVLVLVGALDDAPHVALRRERDRPGDVRTGRLDGVHDLACGTVEDLVVVRLEADPDLLVSSHRLSSSSLASAGPWTTTGIRERCS